MTLIFLRFVCHYFPLMEIRVEDGLYLLGNEHLLNIPATGFLSSPTSRSHILHTCRLWARLQAETGKCIMCGNHRGPESEVFEELLTGIQPLILVLARGIPNPVPEPWIHALEMKRLLVISFFHPKIDMVTRSSHLLRNHFMIQHPERIGVGHERPGGNLEQQLASAKCEIIYLCSDD